MRELGLGFCACGGNRSLEEFYVVVDMGMVLGSVVRWIGGIAVFWQEIAVRSARFVDRLCRFFGAVGVA